MLAVYCSYEEYGLGAVRHDVRVLQHPEGSGKAGPAVMITSAIQPAYKNIEKTYGAAVCVVWDIENIRCDCVWA